MPDTDPALEAACAAWAHEIDLPTSWEHIDERWRWRLLRGMRAAIAAYERAKSEADDEANSRVRLVGYASLTKPTR